MGILNRAQRWLLPRTTIALTWGSHFRMNGNNDSSLLKKIKKVLNDDISWSQARRIVNLSISFHAALAQLIEDNPQSGMFAASEKAAKLFTETLRKLTEILLPENLKDKTAICIFGSTSRGELSPQSDADYVLIFDRALSEGDAKALRKIRKKLIDLCFIFKFPFEGASGVFELTENKDDPRAKIKGLEVCAALDLQFLAGRRSIYEDFINSCKRSIFSDRRKHLGVIFSMLDELPNGVTDLKRLQRRITLLKYISSLFHGNFYESTRRAVMALKDSSLITNAEYQRLSMIMDRLLFLRMIITAQNDTKIDNVRLEEYLQKAYQEKNPVRIAENFILLGIRREDSVNMAEILLLFKDDFEFLKEIAAKLRKSVLAD